MFILSLRVCFLAFVCCTFFLNLQYIFTIGQKWLNENYLWIMVCSWKCLYTDCLSKCLYTDFRPLSKYVHVGASIWIFLIDRRFQCFNGCSSVHVNVLWTAGTQAPTAPRWPHHHECCMMGTWGDEIISKGNPIIFSPTLHLFYISSLFSSISPPSSKSESGMTHPFTPLPWCLLSDCEPPDSPVYGLVCFVSAYKWVGSVFLPLMLMQWVTKDPSVSGSGHFLTETLSLLVSHLHKVWVPRSQEGEEMPCLRMLACMRLV